MPLADDLCKALDAARVLLADDPAVARVEADFSALTGLLADGDPDAGGKAMEIIKGLYGAAVPPTAPAADAPASPQTAAEDTSAATAEPAGAELLPPPGPGTTPVPDSTLPPGSPASSAPGYGPGGAEPAP